MTEPIGHNQMVRIDGARVKKLREEKALTQLYVATAVGVTTDTISRWENKRYPTIKKENGLKLAEALEVVLDDILERAEQPLIPPDKITSLDDRKKTTTDPSLKKIWPLLLLSITIGILLAGISFVFLKQSSSTSVTAERILPVSCPPGQPFPVAIEVAGFTGKQLTLIVKEQPPSGFSVISSSPELPSSGTKNGDLRWLTKVGEATLFVYTGTLEKNHSDKNVFSGSVAIGKDKGAVLIEGPTTIIAGNHHWADIDMDNSISDSEILAAYDRFGEIVPLKPEMDRIEEMWLGSGYRWDQQQKDFVILP